METKNRRTPVKISVSPWKLTLPGKVLAVCLCLLPFLTRQVYRIVPAEIQKAYYLSSNQIADFEQFCREIFLLNKRDGMKYREIAAKFQISVNTVDNHISKALRLIREGAQKVYAFLFN